MPWTSVVWITLIAAAPAQEAAQWHSLGWGLEYTQLSLPGGGGKSATLHVVRVDPARTQLCAELASSLDGRRRTAAEWCQTRGLAVAINLGMFAADGLTHLGYLRAESHEVEGAWHPKYRSAFGVAPGNSRLPALRWMDLDHVAARNSLDGYALVVQNLRVVRKDRHIVWAAQPRRWSEAAIGYDGQHRLLLLFCRDAIPMAELARQLLAAPLDVRGIMHAEGGPEASLSIHAGGINLDLCGSFETGFREDDTNTVQWAIPNVLGVRVAR